MKNCKKSSNNQHVWKKIPDFSSPPFYFQCVNCLTIKDNEVEKNQKCDHIFFQVPFTGAWACKKCYEYMYPPKMPSQKRGGFFCLPSSIFAARMKSFTEIPSIA